MFDCIVRDVTEQGTCVICMEEKNVKNYSSIFECKCKENFFHEKCWQEYRLKFNTCPLCRKKALNIIIEIRPVIPESIHVEVPGHFNCFLFLVVFVNFIYWCVIMSYIIIGLITSREYDQIYVIATINLFIAFTEICITWLDLKNCAFGFVYKWAQTRIWCWRILSFWIVGRILAIILTIIFLNDSRDVQQFYTAFTMIIVHFAIIIGSLVCLYMATWVINSES
jgi:hypothetical protein